MIPKIIIEISGGMVSSVYSNEVIEYIVVDKDNFKVGENFIDGPYIQDNIDNMPYLPSNHYNSPGEKEVKRILRELNF